MALFQGLRQRFGAAGQALTVHAYHELEPGARWQALLDATWPAYRALVPARGRCPRPRYIECRRALREHMPELVPTWERMCELAGGGDSVARMLSIWTPPRFIEGCSQVTRGSPPVIVRNYDYAPSQLEGVIASTGYTGRRVVGTSDCLWGLLDGVNDLGLAASITFGGRRPHGRGFGIALVVRYLLETCATAERAAETLARLPVHFSYNVMLADAGGGALTTFVRPDAPAVTLPLRVATNHQEAIEWPEYAKATRTVERERHLLEVLDLPGLDQQSLVQDFLREPLYGRKFGHGFGTLYTAVLRPAEGLVEYRWPEDAWSQSIDEFREGQRTVTLRPARDEGGIRVPWRALAPA